MFNLILTLGMAYASINAPVTNKELRNVAVKIVNSTMNSGGTGSILSSSKSGSLILTNKHVCQVVKFGGYVVKDRLNSRVVSYKEYENHDLCLVKVNTNLGVNLKVSDKKPEMSDVSLVSGFPRLMPNTITRGHFSDELTVGVMMGEEECTEEEFLTNMMCMFFGFKPLIKYFKSQHTSNLIQPGNSGSGVFNGKGELSGVVFAGSGDLGFSLIVPHAYVVHFLKHQKDFDWITPEVKLNEDDMYDEEMFSEDITRACSFVLIKPKRIKDLCSSVYFDRLYRKRH